MRIDANSPRVRDIVEEIATDVDGTVRTDYSGRGMFGKTCLGVVCESPTRAIELAGQYGLRGARQDSMGLRAIVYWPHPEIIETEEEEDEE